MIHNIDQAPVYDVMGPPDAFPIVLIHGAAWTRKMWDPQLQSLSHTFRVIAVDLPGHGVLHGESFRLDAAVHIVIDSLKHETTHSALVVGLSLGGYVAIACARDYPQHIAGLILSGCCIDYRGILGFLSRLDSSLVTAFVSERRLNRMQEKSLRSMFPPSILEPQLAAGFSWKVMPQVYSALASYDFHAMLKTFSGPVLILNGENDKLNRNREATLLQAASHGQLQIIQQASHLCNLEQPEAFTRQVRIFAQGLNDETDRRDQTANSVL